jgi:predicted ATPase
MNIVELAVTKDHRERQLHTLQNYFVISDRDEDDSINELLFNTHLKEYSVTPNKKSGSLEVLGREINYLAINKKTIVFYFIDL